MTRFELLWREGDRAAPSQLTDLLKSRFDPNFGGSEDYLQGPGPSAVDEQPGRKSPQKIAALFDALRPVSREKVRECA